MVSSSSNTRVTWSPRWTVRFFLWAMTLARKSLRALAYASRVMRDCGEILVMVLVRQAVSHAQQGEGVAQFRGRAAAGALEAFLQVMRGELAVGGEVVGLQLGDLADHRAADLERRLVELGLHAPGAGVAGAAL